MRVVFFFNLTLAHRFLNVWMSTHFGKFLAIRPCSLSACSWGFPDTWSRAKWGSRVRLPEMHRHGLETYSVPGTAPGPEGRAFPGVPHCWTAGAGWANQKFVQRTEGMGRVPNATGCLKAGTSVPGDCDSRHGQKALPWAPQSYGGGSSCRDKSQIAKLPGSCPTEEARGSGRLHFIPLFKKIIWGYGVRRAHLPWLWGGQFPEGITGVGTHVGRWQGLGGGAAPSSTSGQSAHSEAGGGRAAVCTRWGAGGPPGDLAATADPQHCPGRRGSAIHARGCRGWKRVALHWAHWVGPGLAESQPAGPRGGGRGQCVGGRGGLSIPSE